MKLSTKRCSRGSCDVISKALSVHEAAAIGFHAAASEWSSAMQSCWSEPLVLLQDPCANTSTCGQPPRILVPPLNVNVVSPMYLPSQRRRSPRFPSSTASQSPASHRVCLFLESMVNPSSGMLACPASLWNQAAGGRKLCTLKPFGQLSEMVQPGVRYSLLGQMLP